MNMNSPEDISIQQNQAANAEKIGAFGGCIVGGFGNVSARDCFYQHIRKRYRTEHHRFLTFRLESYGQFSHWFFAPAHQSIEAYDELDQAIDKMIEQRVSQVVLVIRPHLHRVYCNLVGKAKPSYYFHPIFGNPMRPFQHIWVERIHIVFHKLFDLSLTRLSFFSRSSRLMERRFVDMLNTCESNGIKLVLDNLDLNIFGPHYQRRFNRLISRLRSSSLANAKWLDLKFGRQYFEEDGFHLNKEGHQYLAEHLYPVLFPQVTDTTGGEYVPHSEPLA